MIWCKKIEEKQKAVKRKEEQKFSKQFFLGKFFSKQFEMWK